MDLKTKEQLLRKGNGLLCPVAVFVRDGKILLGLRNYTKDKWKEISVWTLPGGRSGFDEFIEDSLRREVHEEIGIKEFEIIDFIGEFPGAKEGDIGLLFFCKTSDSIKLMELDKFSEWKWFDVNDFPDNYVNKVSHEILLSYLNKKE